MINLKDISIFNTLDQKDLKEIERNLVQEKFSKRKVIFQEGDPAEWLYIVEAGKVKITKLSQEGKEIILEIIKPLDFFGALAVIRGFPYPANAVAMDDTTVLKIARSRLMAVLDRFPNVMYCLVQNMSERMKGTHETMKNIALEKVSARIAALLLKLSEQTGRKSGDGTLIDLNLTKQDIAEMVGTTVETSIRTMSKFKKLGVLTEKAGKIIIKDTEKLRSLSA